MLSLSVLYAREPQDALKEQGENLKMYSRWPAADVRWLSRGMALPAGSAFMRGHSLTHTMPGTEQSPLTCVCDCAPAWATRAG